MTSRSFGSWEKENLSTAPRAAWSHFPQLWTPLWEPPPDGEDISLASTVPDSLLMHSMRDQIHGERNSPLFQSLST